jgi:hypothetical protein
MGDCTNDGHVTIDELVLGVNIAFGVHSVDECVNFDGNGDRVVTIDEVVGAVHSTLNGCGLGSPTPSQTVTRTRTPTATATAVPNDSPVPGLEPLSQELIPMGHAARLLKNGELAYVATSFGGVQTFRVVADGSLLMLSGGEASDDPETPRCITLALHAPSATLYCAAADAAGIRLLDLQDPTHPAVRAGEGNSRNTARGYRDLYVAGDTLYVAAFEDGLLRATIASDGTLGPLEPTGVEGVVVGVRGEGDDVAVISRDHGLTAAQISDGMLEVTGHLPLDGPPLGVKVRSGRAVVALGSQGVVIADLGASGPTLSATLDVPGVVVTADLHGETVAAGGPTGVFLIDRRTATPRLAGYQPANSGVLDLYFDEENLVSIDWDFLRTHQVHLDGHIVEVDSEEGGLLAAGVDGEVYVVNHGDLPLNLTVFLQSPSGGPALRPLYLQVPAAGPAMAIVPAATVRAMQGKFGGGANFAVVEAGRHSFFVGASMSLVEATNPVAEHKVPLESEFPQLTSTNPIEPSLPVPGVRNLIGFIQTDCALQWPEIEDLAWLARHDRLPEGMQIKLLNIGHIDANPWVGAPFMSLWGVRDDDWGLFEDFAASLPGFEGMDTDRVFDAVFGLSALLPGPDTTAYYYIDESGLVRRVLRRYRGVEPLKPIF